MDTNSRKQVNSDDLHTVIATSMDGFLLVDMGGNIIEVNDSYCQLIGYTREQLLSTHVSSVDAVDNQNDIAQRMEKIFQMGSLRFETKHRHKNGTIIDIEASTNYSSAHGGSVFSFVRDISFVKRNREIVEARLRLIEYSHKHSLCELLRETLDEAEKLTGSCIGFFHFMDSSTQMLTLQAWSTRTAAEFCKAEGTGSHYPVAQAGVWVDCVHERRPVIHNDYASLPHRKGMPEGHAAVVRELVVPIFRDGTIVAIFGVGNKQIDYNQLDIEVITILADLAWEVAERKKTEEALIKSEAILSSSQHLAKVGGWKWDIALQSMTWTEETYRIHDFEPGTITPGSAEHIEKSLNCYDPEDRQTVLAAFQRCVEHGEEYDLELPFTTAAGRRLWIRTAAKPVWHEERVAKAIGNIMDITERKRLDEALAQQADFTLRVFNSIDAHLAVISPNGTILRTNEAWQRFMRENCGASELICGEGINYFVEYDKRWGDVSQAREAFEGIRDVQNGKMSNFSLEYPCHVPNGEKRFFLLKVLPLVGETGTVLISHTNITKQRETEERVEASEAHFRLMTENVSDVLWRLDGDYRFTYISPADERLRGFRADELIGHDVFELMTAKGAASSMDAIRKRLDTLQQGIKSGSLTFEAEQICKDGSAIWTEIISTPEFNSDGKLTGFHGVTRDISERKKAEEKLHDALNYIQTLLRSSPTGIVTFRASGETVFANEAAAEIVGTTIENMLKQNFRELESWLRIGLLDKAEHVIATNKSQRFDIQFVTTFGKHAYLDCQLVPFTFNGEQLLLFEAMDIGDRKRTEETLKRTADFLEESQRIARIGSYDYDILSGLWTCTKALEKIFGIDAQYEKNTEGWLGIVASEQREQMQEYLSHHVITTRQRFDKEYLIRRVRDGELRWVHGYGKLHFNDTGTPVRMIGTIMDITERKQTEEALRYKLSELDAIYTHAPMMICLVDSDRRILYANPAFRVIQGVSEKELIGGHACGVFGCVNAKDDPQGCGHGVKCRDCTLLRAIKDSFETGTGHINEEHHIVVNSEELHHEFTLLGSTALIYTGEQRHLLLSLLDISELKKAEEQKRDLENQLYQVQKLESLGVLAGGIAHDFNNILAIIVGNCFLAKLHPDTAENYLVTIEKASERAAELCRQMLAYAGKSQFVETHVNFSGLVDEMINMLKATISQNIIINLCSPVDMPPLKADASQLRQVVMNLIINAAEAIGDEHGEVLVTLTKRTIASGKEDKDHLGRAIPAGSYICLEVTDNGCGMDEETMRRIFEPFFTTKFTGRGLGMSAVLGIITAHKGALQLVSKPGLGTTYKVYLPIESNYLAGIDNPEQPSNIAWQGNGTILLVEDEEQIQLIATIMLESLGFSVIRATNGEEALKMYQNHPDEITLVLTDIGMPVMDGYELFGKLKKLKPKLPIIISSGFGENVITARIARDDIAGFIIKPYNFDLLSDVLKSVIEDTRLTAL